MGYVKTLQTRQCFHRACTASSAFHTSMPVHCRGALVPALPSSMGVALDIRTPGRAAQSK